MKALSCLIILQKIRALNILGNMQNKVCSFSIIVFTFGNFQGLLSLTQEMDKQSDIFKSLWNKL